MHTRIRGTSRLVQLDGRPTYKVFDASGGRVGSDAPKEGICKHALGQS